jgi:hypothetical protein
MLLLGLVMVAGTAGCGSDRDRGINKDRDMPREGPPATKK